MTTEQALVAITRREEADELQIIQQLSGELVDHYVYRFNDAAGRVQKGLSISGIEEYAHRLGNIKVWISSIDEFDTYWRVMAKARDTLMDVEFESGVHVDKFFKNGKENQHAFTIAQSKAIRNAIKRLMPKSVEVAAIAALEASAGTPQQPARRRQPASRQPAPRNVDASTGEIGFDPDNPAFTDRGHFMQMANEHFEMPSNDVIACLGVETIGDIQGEGNFVDHWTTLKSAHDEFGGE